MRYTKVRLDKLNFSSTPVRLYRSGQYMEQLKTSLDAKRDELIDALEKRINHQVYVDT